MTYENLLAEAHNENISVIENALFKSESNGLISGNVIGLNKKIRSTRKRACTLSEELGHYHTTVGNIINPQQRNASKNIVPEFGLLKKWSGSAGS